MCWSKSGPGLDQDQTNIDGPWRSQSQSQKFHQGLDCPVSSLAKMAPDQTKPNFPNTTSTDDTDSQEACIHSAVEAVCAHMLSFCDAAKFKQFSIPATTISNHLCGGKAPSVAHEFQQPLSNEQQKVVIEWLRWHGNNGNLMTHEQLRALILI